MMRRYDYDRHENVYYDVDGNEYPDGSDSLIWAVNEAAGLHDNRPDTTIYTRLDDHGIVRDYDSNGNEIISQGSGCLAVMSLLMGVVFLAAIGIMAWGIYMTFLAK